MRRRTAVVVDDDAKIRRFVRRCLTNDYIVFEARSGPEAMQVFQNFPGHIDVVVQDLVLPGSGGLDIACYLRESRPRTTVLYISGYLDSVVVHSLHIANPADILLKPFTDEALLGRVRSIINNSKHKPL